MGQARRFRGPVAALCLASAALATVGVTGHVSPAGASGSQPAKETCTPSMPAATSTAGTPVAQASNTFGFNLFRRQFAAAPQSDLFLSPLSVAVALDMLYDGARGRTASAMARTLALGTMSRQSVIASAASLLHTLQIGEPAPSNPGGPALQPTKMRVANSVWSRSGLNFTPQFTSDLQRYFGAQAQSLDFNSSAAPTTINRWVSCETNGKITQIVDSTQALMMLLVNAVYFEGGWTYTFDPRLTTNQTFTTGTGATTHVRMMHQTQDFGYYRGRNVQVLTMPYGQSRRFSMVVVLPNKGVSLAQFAPRMTRANWGYWVKRTATMGYGDVAFPHIDMTYSANLTAPLSALGMGAAFGSRADFSGVCAEFCKVNEVLHKTFLHVDEKGTTAAAVTGVGLGGGGPPPKPFHFIADHPFFLGIRDGRSGAVLFLGAVNKP
ncbi:MAG TPA: serpin family protein [Chloroflexota bacterium]|nr:serpin family protein [Chloroflexota bacterium]